MGSSGGGGRYAVHPEELTKIGRRAADLGDRLIELKRATAEDSAAVVRIHGGWAFSAALERVQSSCERDVEGFGRWLDDMGDRLMGAARDYEETDEWAVAKLRGEGV
ncbi:Excreted virulence factor EspC, type VII ESX diderm [Actinopolyspora xinjiangensis]|uniref:Excreted virulence factor EspC, type VII ESX diderm n=1 Tax=Actinopolyspora xinjiangensis TaxID=405564 RepID=A0A1H0WHC8_9ACTN|nr:type VII secretion target [Actinopolyspora xinjiangensis]SDP89885.1 Excreted virulence factor EspC, type VII ESX diderm [Actinopolyspora xinjiangensis]